MLSKKDSKQRAIKLRKTGHSLAEISDILRISKASASLWLRDVPLSIKAQEKIALKRVLGRKRSAVTHREQLDMRMQNAIDFANDVLSRTTIETDIARILCALLYWCEGEKTKNDKILSFANSDMQLSATFLSLLRRGFNTDESKFRICLHLHDYHEEAKQIGLWSVATGVPRHQFYKSYRKPNTGKRRRSDYAGCASIRYYDAEIARQVQGLARAFLKRYGPIS